MILVTVGSMLPFDRLVRAMDRWAANHEVETLVAQIGNGSFVPAHMRSSRLFARKEFSSLIEQCRLIVGHAGIGTVLAAQEARKPLLVLPRRADLHEHTNDHQLHTAQWLADKPGIFVVQTEVALWSSLDQLIQQKVEVVATIGNSAPPAFIGRIRAFLTQ